MKYGIESEKEPDYDTIINKAGVVCGYIKMGKIKEFISIKKVGD